MEKYRFYILLGALTSLLFFTPLVGEFVPTAMPTLSRVVITLLFIFMLMSAVVAVAETRFTTRIATLLAVPLVMLELLQMIFPRNVILISAYLLAIVFLGYVVTVLVRYLFKTEEVSTNTICAAVCAYLLLGILWAMVLSSVAVVSPHAFAHPGADAHPALIRFGDEDSIDAMYFSFVTLTTLGYGDIVPTSATSKMLVSMEAIMGQLFLAVLVARLVGLHIAYATAEKQREIET